MTTTNNSNRENVKGKHRTIKNKVYALSLMMFSIMPTIMTGDTSWLVIGGMICVALFCSE